MCVENPLSNDQQSSWHRHFDKSAKVDEIEKDVLRTYSDDDFCQSDAGRDILRRVLLTWSIEHPQVNVHFKSIFGPHECTYVL